MNGYELLRPDGSGAGIWACAECDRPHAIAWRGSKPASELNQKAANECCAPRNCRYCGEVTTRNRGGQYSWAHDECVPKYEPEPPHPSMASPYARLLYQKMSSISEDFWCAGWMRGNEYMLWSILHGDMHNYGWGRAPYEDLEELRALSAQAGGWIWSGSADAFTPQLVSFEVWRSILDKTADCATDKNRFETQD